MKKFLVFLMACSIILSSLVLPALAIEYPSNTPPLPEVDDGWECIVVRSPYNGFTFCFAWDTAQADCEYGYYEPEQKYGLWLFSHSTGYSYRVWSKEWAGDSTYWKEVQGSTQTKYTYTYLMDYPNDSDTTDHFDSILYSTKDIYDLSGKLFFQATPLTEAMQLEAGKKMSLMLKKNLSILVPCGVGCLALVMVLPLLVKKLKIFLN